jgi:NADH:ubiquinone oxidoreductase subunit E
MKTGEDGTQKLAEVLAPYRTKRSAGLTGSDGPPQSNQANILQGLLAVQESLRSVPLSTIPEIARSLGVTEADVAGVLSYYPELRTTPPGRHLVRACTGESCVANHCGKVLIAIHDRGDVKPPVSMREGRAGSSPSSTG